MLFMLFNNVSSDLYRYTLDLNVCHDMIHHPFCLIVEYSCLSRTLSVDSFLDESVKSFLYDLVDEVQNVG